MADLSAPTLRSPRVPGARLRIETAGGAVAIFDSGGTARAVEDGCLRCGSSLLTGRIEGSVVTCQTCGWRYDIESGCVIDLPALRLSTYAVQAAEPA